MKERGIIMCAEMVRQTLAGNKGQTRRVVSGYQITGPNSGGLFDWYKDSRICGKIRRADQRPWVGAHRPGDAQNSNALLLCPYGVPGDRLWVRETWYDDNALRASEPRPSVPDKYIAYRADHDCNSWEAGCPCVDDGGRSSWRPSIFMPRWASRITLELTGVRVERLQDIGEDDALAEGMTAGPSTTPREQYELLWDELNGHREGCAWVENPWVWALGFSVLPQEQLGRSVSA